MSNSNVVYSVRLMEVMAQAEKRIAAFYETCGQQFPLSRKFWEGLACEEKGHAEIIDQVMHAAIEEPEMFEAGESSPLEALQAFMSRLESGFEMLTNDRLTERNALLMAYLIENTFAEHSYARAIKAKDPDYVRNLDKLTSDSAGHRTRVLEKMKEQEGI
ncbi:MAG: hypothetical protein HY912_07285 [Desulfomonile tiedjei]|uniref:Rubrerythrin diiron-binding domain-containing protein n=1 Tax=Desulfomonile tiedjei TaxID=2358 RepID=A0A9D6V3E7_9BACT|nr:hypothetical protein [Desulfomonile tiedjei]